MIAPVICDWLDVTYHPELNPRASLELFMASRDVEPEYGGRYRLGSRDRQGIGGVVTMGRMYGSFRVSFSGGALSYLRTVRALPDCLSVLSDFPHRVTRLDAAYDVPRDGADVLDELRHRYPTGRVSLRRKALPVKLMLAVRDDGRETGTFYVGHRSAARATARVYDKRQERLDKGYPDPCNPWTRYEVTVRKDFGATLRDVMEPERLFWHIAAPSLLDKPDGVPEWEEGWGGGWSADTRPELLPAEVLARRVGSSPELDLLRSIADGMGENGRIFLARQLLNSLGVHSEGLSVRSSALSEA